MCIWWGVYENCMPSLTNSNKPRSTKIYSNYLNNMDCILFVLLCFENGKLSLFPTNVAVQRTQSNTSLFMESVVIKIDSCAVLLWTSKWNKSIYFVINTFSTGTYQGFANCVQKAIYTVCFFFLIVFPLYLLYGREHSS